MAPGGARLFDYDTIKAHLGVEDAFPPVERAFAQLAQGKVDVPIPMHIGIDETGHYGPGDVHIKGGYVSGTPTFTVTAASLFPSAKLERVSFYRTRSELN